jgi:hypothetical protein
MAECRARRDTTPGGRGQAGGIIFWGTNRSSQWIGWIEIKQEPLASRERRLRTEREICATRRNR